MTLHLFRRCVSLSYKSSNSSLHKYSNAGLLVPTSKIIHQQRLNMSSNQPLEISDAAKNASESIWVNIVDLVRKHQPVNLGQGFPDFPEVVPDLLKKALIKTQAPDASVYLNQYCRGQGHPLLVSAIADIYGPLFGRTIDAMNEILVTVGGYESLHCVINSVTNPGDEVILIEPYFDSYSETIKQCGGVCRFIPLKMKPGGTTSSDFFLDEDELASMFNEKTKAIIVNTPHNPTGKVFKPKEIEMIADLCKKHNCLYISDEVYEWLVYDGHEHFRAATLPDMWERTVTICSAGKTFNITGWKTGWSIGPKYLIDAAMKFHQGMIYTIPTPLQVAVAEMFEQEKKVIGTKDSYWYWLHNTMKDKRERIFKMLTDAGFHPILPDGGYFMVADINCLRDKPLVDSPSKELDQRALAWLIQEKGLACIPVSAFFSKDHKSEHDNYLRFCFIKGDETLDQAEEKFKNLNI